jgi:superfamily II DNA or RNA helicase
MILGHNKVLLKYLHDAIEHRNMATVGYYVGGMKEKDLKITEGKKVVVATYAMASEGLDIKTLSSLIMATPKSTVEQCIGRILRTKHERPLVVDIVDQHEFFNRQWIKRKRFYVKEKYKIKRANNTSYFKDELVTIFDGVKKNKKYKKKVYQAEDLLQGVCLIQDDD